MSKTKTLIKSLVSTAVGLSLVACAQQENPLVVADGTFRPMTQAEVLEKGLDSSGNKLYSESKLSPVLQSFYPAKTKKSMGNEYREGMETMIISTKEDVQTITVEQKALDYVVGTDVLETKEAYEALNGKTPMTVVKKPELMPSADIRVYKTDKKLGKAVVESIKQKAGGIGALEKSEIKDLAINEGYADIYMAVEVSPITNHIVLVKYYDLEVLGDQTIPVLVDATYYQAVFQSELDRMNVALQEVNNKLAKILTDKEKASVVVEETANPDAPITIEDIDAPTGDTVTEEIPSNLPTEDQNDAATSDINDSESSEEESVVTTAEDA